MADQTYDNDSDFNNATEQDSTRRRGGPTGLSSLSEQRTVCPVCLSTELHPENQCTLRCGHALCNLCLPQLLSPNCPLCRRPIWHDHDRNNALQATTPWLLDAGTMLMHPGGGPQEEEEDPRRAAAAAAADDLSSLSTHAEEEEEEEEEDQIPVLLLTRAQVRRIFNR